MGILIFEKNKIDIDAPNVSMTVTDAVATNDGTDFLPYLRNRRNDSGWATTDSTDAANTTIEVDMIDTIDITDIVLVGHNFASYTLKYWDGAAWQDFSTAVSVSGNTVTTTHHNFDSIGTSKVQLIITGAQTADSDKFLRQLIITKRIGEFTGQPMVKKPTHERGRKARKMLSGRVNVTRALGAFSCSLVFPPTKNDADHAIIERMFDSINGFLVWLSGGDSSQFPMSVQGFRLEDIYLMTCLNDLEPEWKDGRFQHGQAIEIKLAESRM